VCCAGGFDGEIHSETVRGGCGRRECFEWGGKHVRDGGGESRDMGVFRRGRM